MTLRWLMFVAALPAAARADATGEVRGVVDAPSAKHVAVWLEGALPPPSLRERVAISQRSARFVPDFVVVAVGQTVDMPNDDRMSHNVFSVSPTKKFDLGHYPQGESRSVKFDRVGVVDLFCNIHENMHATVVVAPSGFFASVAPSEQFTIARVPPGTYTLVAFAPGAGQKSSTVTVTAGAASTVRVSLGR